MIFSNKELTILSLFPILFWGIIFMVCLTISMLNYDEYLTITITFDETNLIMIGFLYGLIGLTVNRIFEVYEERQLRRQNERIL